MNEPDTPLDAPDRYPLGRRGSDARGRRERGLLVETLDALDSEYVPRQLVE